MDAAGKRPEVQGRRAAYPIASCPRCEKLEMEAGKRPEVQGGEERPEGGAEERSGVQRRRRRRHQKNNALMRERMTRRDLSYGADAEGPDVQGADADEILSRRKLKGEREAMPRKQVPIEIEAVKIIGKSRGVPMEEALREAEAAVEMDEQALRETQAAVSEIVEEQALKETQTTVRETVQEQALKEIQTTVTETAEDKVKKGNLKKKRRNRKGKVESRFDPNADPNAYEAILHRNIWNSTFARRYGSYETTTSIPPMRFTDDVCDSASPLETLQIFSVKVIDVAEGVSWPLSVYGKVAARDTVDRHRNMIFDRERDNCQIIHEDDPYLALTGPSRAVVLSVHHSFIEVELKIRGDSDDEEFSYLQAL